MKKQYVKPKIEIIVPRYKPVMQGLTIIISGQTTPEESDANQSFFDDETDMSGNDSEYINWKSINVWED